MTRARLPNRRRAVTTTIALPGWPAAHATVGIDATGRVREIFIRAAKPASDLDRVLDDAAVCVSVALQHGARAGDLAASIARRLGEPSTVIGAALDFAASIDGGIE